MEIVEQNSLDALAAQARERYEDAMRLAIDAKATAREAVLAMADCGTMLLLGREQAKAGKGDWLASVGIPLEHADKAVYLARNREQLELDLWPADVAKVGATFVGLLPPPGSANRDVNDPERTIGPTMHWLSFAGKLQRSLSAIATTKPLDQWRDDERQNVKLALKPIVEFFNNL